MTYAPQGAAQYFKHDRQSLPGSEAKRKPDVVLLRPGHIIPPATSAQPPSTPHVPVSQLWGSPGTQHWCHVGVLIEIKNQKQDALVELRKQAIRGALEVFRAQPGRTFVLALAVQKNGFRLLLIHASAVFTSSNLSYAADPAKVAYLLQTLPNLSPAKLGFPNVGRFTFALPLQSPYDWKKHTSKDEHWRKQPYGSVSRGRTIRQLKALFARHRVIGRATSVYVHDSQSDSCVVKSSFVDVSRDRLEHQVFAAISKQFELDESAVEGLVSAKEYDVGEPTRTILGLSEARWTEIVTRNPKVVERQQQISIIAPVGRSLLPYRSPVEVIEAMISAVEGTKSSLSLCSRELMHTPSQPIEDSQA